MQLLLVQELAHVGLCFLDRFRTRVSLYLLRLKPYMAPATMSIPNTITTKGPRMSMSPTIQPVSRRYKKSPATIIIAPRNNATIATPCGKPKHSSLTRLSSKVPNSNYCYTFASILFITCVRSFVACASALVVSRKFSLTRARGQGISV